MMEISIKPVGAGRQGKMRISAGLIETLAVAAVGAALSLLHKGFVFGIENNIFHLPIVASLYDEPQYHDDMFIQSLRHYSSGVWLLLGGFDKHFGHVQALFFVLAFLSRWLCFVGFLCCASLLGIVDRRDKIIFSLILCFVSFMNVVSFAGSGGLFLNYFTHSEIANGTVLLAIYFAAKGRFSAATAMCGVTFFINAFVAFWLVPILGLVALSLLMERKATPGEIIGRTLVGLLPCVPFVIPVFVNIVSNPDFGKSIDFDFATYLREYFPGHVLIETIPMPGLIALFALILLGAVAFYWLGRGARQLQAAYCGVILLYAAGIVVPFFASAPVILNLHLLRSSAVIHLLAALAVVALATNWLRDDREPVFLLGSLLVVSLSWGGFGFCFAILIILSSHFSQTVQQSKVFSRQSLSYGILALVVGILWPLSTWQNVRFNQLFAETVAEWTAVADWARDSTSTTAIFLVPNRPEGNGTAEPPASDLALSITVVFEFLSHRRIWVDHKRGAAVMWTPSYYRVWRTRLNEVEALNSLDQRLTYARRHGIGYVIDRCHSALPVEEGVFRTARLCVFPVAAAAVSAQ
jgi:hypothetical protein